MESGQNKRGFMCIECMPCTYWAVNGTMKSCFEFLIKVLVFVMTIANRSVCEWGWERGSLGKRWGWVCTLAELVFIGSHTAVSSIFFLISPHLHLSSVNIFIAHLSREVLLCSTKLPRGHFLEPRSRIASYRLDNSHCSATSLTAFRELFQHHYVTLSSPISKPYATCTIEGKICG